MISLITYDLSSFFSSFVRMISLALLVVILNVFLWILPNTSIMEYGFADLTMLYSSLPFVFIFLVPSITMNFIVEDFQSGRSELLLTKPISLRQYLSAHYISGCLFSLVFLLLTLTSYYTISQLRTDFSVLDHGQIIGAYFGMFILILVFVAIGLLCSSISKNQAGAFLLTVIICYALLVLPGYLSEIGAFSGGFDHVLAYFSLDTHLESLARGLLELKTVIYSASLISLSMIGSYFILKSKMR